MTKTKKKRDDVLTKRNEALIDRDEINAKREKIINLFNKMIANETNEKENDNVEFKQKKKKLINFKIVMMTIERKMMIKRKTLIENDDLQMSKIFDVRNSIERVLTKFVIDDTTTFSSIFKNLSSDFEKFLE